MWKCNVNLKPPSKYANFIDEADWIEFVNYCTQDKQFLKISEQNCKRVSNPIYPYRASRMGYREVEEKILEQSETPSPSSAALDLDVLKQFLPQSAKRLIKADAAVLQDRYDSLAERFQAMEKRMEAGKFVEGPEASTTVKESFTHPRNHIPIPEGINNCKLFLDTPCTQAVAIGTVYNTQDAIIHHAQIPSNHLKVSIDISIEDDALLPIPVEEDIIIVGLALATFVAWPKHLIDVVPIMGKVFADHSATSPPRIDEHASKKAKVNLPADSTINISFPEPIYGFPEIASTSQIATSVSCLCFDDDKADLKSLKTGRINIQHDPDSNSRKVFNFSISPKMIA
ncbi:hypothetical protein Lal_00012377 [Lupinus albus]|nr:hypothetical protein Lal_00012377 [Lupinus albus]